MLCLGGFRQRRAGGLGGGGGGGRCRRPAARSFPSLSRERTALPPLGRGARGAAAARDACGALLTLGATLERDGGARRGAREAVCLAWRNGTLSLSLFSVRLDAREETGGRHKTRARVQLRMCACMCVERWRWRGSRGLDALQRTRDLSSRKAAGGVGVWRRRRRRPASRASGGGAHCKSQRPPTISFSEPHPSLTHEQSSLVPCHSGRAPKCTGPSAREHHIAGVHTNKQPNGRARFGRRPRAAVAHGGGGAP